MGVRGRGSVRLRMGWKGYRISMREAGVSGVHRQPVRMGNKGALLSSICTLITQGMKDASHIAAVVHRGMGS